MISIRTAKLTLALAVVSALAAAGFIIYSNIAHGQEGSGNGLRGDYYNGVNFDTLVTSRTDATVNFDWGLGAPATGVNADNFSVRWTGEIQAPSTGFYTFYTLSDDGVRLWINNILVINNWTDHGWTENAVMFSLAAGRYPIKLEFYERGGGATIKLSWRRPSDGDEGSSQEQIIPQTYLFSQSITPPPAAPTADIKANGSNGPISINYNSSATISWTSTNASSCTVSPPNWTGTSGSQSTGNLTSATTYTLSCTGAGGSASDSVTVDVAAAPPPPGLGNGLKGEYYNGVDFNQLVLTRTDSTVDFYWESGSPATGVNVDNFSVRWTGDVEAPATGNYTFYTVSDDGVRLWVNNTQLINNWTDHGWTENSGTISLTIGQRYPIKLEYYERGGGAKISLYWSGPGIEKQIVPQSRLYSSAPSAQPNADIKANGSDGPISIGYNSSATISWSSTNATSCTVTPGGEGWSGTSGSRSTGNLTSSTTYTISCTGAGGSASDFVTVNVGASPSAQPTADIKANNSNGPITINYNTAATISWTSTNASNCTVSPPNWTGTSGSQSTGNLTSSRIYSLSCTSAGGNAFDDITVNVEASAITFCNLSMPAGTLMFQVGGSTNQPVMQINAQGDVAIRSSVVEQRVSNMSGASNALVIRDTTTGNQLFTAKSNKAELRGSALENKSQSSVPANSLMIRDSAAPADYLAAIAPNGNFLAKGHIAYEGSTTTCSTTTSRKCVASQQYGRVVTPGTCQANGNCNMAASVDEVQGNCSTGFCVEPGGTCQNACTPGSACQVPQETQACRSPQDGMKCLYRELCDGSCVNGKTCNLTSEPQTCQWVINEGVAQLVCTGGGPVCGARQEISCWPDAACGPVDPCDINPSLPGCGPDPCVINPNLPQCQGVCPGGCPGYNDSSEVYCNTGERCTSYISCPGVCNKGTCGQGLCDVWTDCVPDSSCAFVDPCPNNCSAMNSQTTSPYVCSGGQCCATITTCYGFCLVNGCEQVCDSTESCIPQSSGGQGGQGGQAGAP